MSTTAEEVTAITKAFSDTTAAFTPIIGPHRDDDLQKIRKTILRILIDIEYDEEKDSLTGILHSSAKYQELFAHPLDRLATPTADPNETLEAEVKTNTRIKLERIYSKSRRRQRLIRAAEKGARKFILAVVKETWYCRLEDD